MAVTDRHASTARASQPARIVHDRPRAKKRPLHRSEGTLLPARSAGAGIDDRAGLRSPRGSTSLPDRTADLSAPTLGTSVPLHGSARSCLMVMPSVRGDLANLNTFSSVLYTLAAPVLGVLVSLRL